MAYRTLVSVVLLILLLSPKSRELVGTLNPDLYLAVALVYCISNIVLVALLPKQIHTRSSSLFAVFFTDIVCLALLSDASGGIGSGLPALLIVSVAASAVLERNRTLATLIAALAVIVLLADSVRLITVGAMTFKTMLPVALLGILTFAVSLLVQAVAQRLLRVEELARSRAYDLYNLQRLSEQVVQNLQTGILLVHENAMASAINSAAGRLLLPDRPMMLQQQRPLESYNEALAQHYQHWRAGGSAQTSPFYADGSEAPLVAHFKELSPGHTDKSSLIFVDDYTPATQYAHSLKLNSLGRLTASIAHEIRNPLGAASHAAQLLLESEQMNDADRHLTNIIHKHCQRMNVVIESVMQISRREAPNPQFLPLADWLENMIQVYRETRQDEPQITLACASRELEIAFDPEHLERVLSNLLDNALRHSEMATGIACAQINVQLNIQAKHCSIEVIDRGEGVAPAEQSKLFEPFYTTVEQGSGMGLFLCKELCDINHAQLQYHSTDDGHGCFAIHITQRR
ncbi:MAG: two-component sensor histidine kinase [Gammaproteobacteria bacterium]|nr:MAG: two-component sensor histidine kinase [Gammaproteobacteria bacterium]